MDSKSIVKLFGDKNIRVPKGKKDSCIFADEHGNPITAKKFILMWKKHCEETL